MKKSMLLSAITLFLPISQSYSQFQWSDPVMIVPDSPNEEHPVFADGFGWMFGSAREWLAFSRNGKEICFIQSAESGWDTTITVVSSDTANNRRPSMTRRQGFTPELDEGMLVWQGRGRGNYDIYYATYRNTMWSQPRILTSHPDDDINPHVVASDTTYRLVWERAGTILYSEFSRETWSPERLLSAPSDTSNHLPRIQSQMWSAYYPRVVWERRNHRDSSFALWYAHRLSGVWTEAESLYQAGNTRRPKFLKYAPVDAIVWELHNAGSVTCEAAYVFRSGNRLRVESPAPLSYPLTQQANPSVNGYMIITAPYLQPTNVFYSVAAWEGRDFVIDSIGVSVLPFGWFPSLKLSAGGNTSSHNPDVSQGIIRPLGFVRIWVAWEARRADRSKLYGSYIDLPIGDVDDENQHSSSFTLHQNYPNPFNPATSIKFQIPNTTHVTLRVFDVLGREVATLVDEIKEAGEHAVVWDASTIASGVYFYRMISGAYTSTRRMLLLK